MTIPDSKRYSEMFRSRRNRSSRLEEFCKKGILKISQNSHENTCVRVYFFKKDAGEICPFLKKETMTQFFSCESFEIFLNTFFFITPPVAASEETGLRNNLVLLFWKEYDNLVKLSRNKRGMKIVCLKSYLAVTSVNITWYISFVTKFYFW